MNGKGKNGACGGAVRLEGLRQAAVSIRLCASSRALVKL